MPFFLFFPRPVVDFWLDPDFYFNESYELNLSWDFFETSNLDEGYEYVDGWPGTVIPNFIPDYDSPTHDIQETYEDVYWNSNEQLLYPEMTSMSLWLDAQDNDSLILDNDGYVVTWINKAYTLVGDGYQGTSSLRPYPIINDGYQYLSFNGDWLEFNHTSGEVTRYVNFSANSRNWHLFAVFKVFSISTNSATADNNDGLLSTSNLTTRHNIHFRNSPSRIVLVKSDSALLSVTQNINLNEGILAEMYHATTNDNLNYKNVFGVYLNNNFISEQNATTTAGTTITYIGRNSGNTAFLNGIIGEIIFYKCNLSSTQRSRTINYLQNKWGII